MMKSPSPHATPQKPSTAAKTSLPGPAALISRRASDRIRAGHPWVYRSDVESLIPPAGEAELPPGALTAVLDNRGIPLGTGLYSSASQIALRLIAADVPMAREQFLALIRERLVSALSLRSHLLAADDGQTNACRLVFSEADALPGIIIDRYGDLVILQLLTQGMATDDVRATVVETLREYLTSTQPSITGLTIWERPDPRIRELEELPPASTTPLYSAQEAAGASAHASAAEASQEAANDAGPLTKSVFSLNGLRFHYDVGSGQKTGAFLDQRENYAAAARHAHGDALDICTYQGGFALHLARVCPRVTGVDASRTALEVAETNLQLNRAHLIDEGNGVDWIEANAFELLRDYEATGQRFDTIVLDPPAFAKTKRAMEGALRGYKEMNLRALKMLRPGGTLVTCSCSHHVSLAEFTQVVAAAASDAHRTVRLLETRAAALDHPAILTIPETSYLKCLICRVN